MKFYLKFNKLFLSTNAILLWYYNVVSYPNFGIRFKFDHVGKYFVWDILNIGIQKVGR